MNIAVIIPVFNRKESSLNCLRQLENMPHGDADVTVIVVDDGSTDGTSEAISDEFPEVVLLKGDGNLWWTGAINTGVRYAIKHQFDYTLFVNDDLELDPDFLLGLIEVSKKYPDALIGGIKALKDSDCTRVIASIFRRKGWFRELYDPWAEQDIGIFGEEIPDGDALSGSSLLIPVNVYQDIGILDEKNFPHNWGDLEFSLRARIAGYQCYLSTKSRVYTDADNPNYHYRYFIESSRREYLRNLFDNYKYTYGFKRIWVTSFMHRPIPLAVILYCKKLIGLIRSIIQKIFLPRSMLPKQHRPSQ